MKTLDDLEEKLTLTKLLTMEHCDVIAWCKWNDLYTAKKIVKHLEDHIPATKLTPLLDKVFPTLLDELQHQELIETGWFDDEYTYTPGESYKDVVVKGWDIRVTSFGAILRKMYKKHARVGPYKWKECPYYCGSRGDVAISAGIAPGNKQVSVRNTIAEAWLPNYNPDKRVYPIDGNYHNYTPSNWTQDVYDLVNGGEYGYTMLRTVFAHYHPEEDVTLFTLKLMKMHIKGVPLSGSLQTNLKAKIDKLYKKMKLPSSIPSGWIE